MFALDPMPSVRTFVAAIAAHTKIVHQTILMIHHIKSKCAANKIMKNKIKWVIFSRCKRISLTCDQGDVECYRRPASITFHFITLVSDMSLPPTGRVLFTYKGPSWYENIDFDMKIVHVQAAGNIERANEKFFRFEIHWIISNFFFVRLKLQLKSSFWF